MNYIWQHLKETQRVLEKIDSDMNQEMINLITEGENKDNRGTDCTPSDGESRSHVCSKYFVV